MKKVIFIFVLASLHSCSDNTQTTGGSIDTKLELEDDVSVTLPDATEIKLTTLAFNKMEHDFGVTKVGIENKYKFFVTNTGKEPLIIESAKASCGCTVPKSPEKPIPPGGSDEIEVIFTANAGQSGPVNKTISVKANTDPEITMLTIRANVIGSMIKEGGDKPVK